MTTEEEIQQEPMLVPGHRGTGHWRRARAPSPETPGDAERSVSGRVVRTPAPRIVLPTPGKPRPGTVASQPLLLISLFAVLCVFLTAGFHGNLHGYFLEFSVSGRDCEGRSSPAPGGTELEQTLSAGQRLWATQGLEKQFFSPFRRRDSVFHSEGSRLVALWDYWGMKTLALA